MIELRFWEGFLARVVLSVLLWKNYVKNLNFFLL